MLYYHPELLYATDAKRTDSTNHNKIDSKYTFIVGDSIPPDAALALTHTRFTVLYERELENGERQPITIKGIDFLRRK